MKILTIVGTRPELIRLSEIIKKLDIYFDHIFVHTGQNFDINLRENFFNDLGLRLPNYQFNLKEKTTGFNFISKMLINIEHVLIKEKPDRALILGDTNSGLASYICKQMHIPVFHMEAGNRCYDDNVPEEVNRRIIDSCSEYLLAYTQRSREQLLIENYPPNKIIVIGNPITEVLYKYSNNINSEKILKKYKVKNKKYILATLHRTENITNKISLQKICNALNKISEEYIILLSVHPKLDVMLKKFNINLEKNIIKCDPFGFKEFITLMENTKIVLTDSGTVPEECSLLQIPSVLIRTSTERPELLENNSMILSGTESLAIYNAFKMILNLKIGNIPLDYQDKDISDKIIKILARSL
ncbi:MAG: UDP-N-acetylglucosamine 2-epimerase (non-hydrolyzing) [bacterium]|nr:UDP-N-acetylglucosamine 2-epimerase (non-hydrolyzing) [bacterium]